MTLELSVGDHVVYPPHGAGTVRAIEPAPSGAGRLISIHVVQGDMTLTVPLDAAEQKGVRAIIDERALKNVLKVLRSQEEPLPEHPQHRRLELQQRNRTGAPVTLAELLRDLDGREASGKKLSPPERDAITAAKRTLGGEIALAQGIAIDAAIELIDAELAKSDRHAA